MNINAYVAHANRTVFGEDAESFRPERWLQDQDSFNRMDNYFLTVWLSTTASDHYLSSFLPRYHSFLPSLAPLMVIILETYS